MEPCCQSTKANAEQAGEEDPGPPGPKLKGSLVDRDRVSAPAAQEAPSPSPALPLRGARVLVPRGCSGPSSCLLQRWGGSAWPGKGRLVHKFQIGKILHFSGPRLLKKVFKLFLY